MASTNIIMLQTVANGLGNLKDDMVFVGGAVAELYASDPAASDIRPTIDVDCVIELHSRTAHAKLEAELRAKGFANDTSEGAPICRFVYEDIKVDVMPSDEKFLGFSNRWYPEGIKNKILKTLPDGTKIYIFPPEYYLASKFEAHNSRGGNDLRQSHDFEDIVYILGNTLDIFVEIENANKSVKEYLKEECQKLLKNSGFQEGLACALSFESWDDRPEIVEEIIRKIAEIE
jgi:hypothetical protein